MVVIVLVSSPASSLRFWSQSDTVPAVRSYGRNNNALLHTSKRFNDKRHSMATPTVSSTGSRDNIVASHSQQNGTVALRNHHTTKAIVLLHCRSVGADDMRLPVSVAAPTVTSSRCFVRPAKVEKCSTRITSKTNTSDAAAAEQGHLDRQQRRRRPRGRRRHLTRINFGDICCSQDANAEVEPVVKEGMF